MCKKNIYMVQVDHLYGNEEKSVYLPYASGLIAAYAWSDNRIKENYLLADLIFWRENIQKAVDSLDHPFLVGFSCYIWNTEYNKAFAQRLKEIYPDCIIVFGGHNVPDNISMLEQFSFIDILIHGEGEKTFKSLLLAINEDSRLSEIPNISFRNGLNEIIKTNVVTSTDLDFPSPYLEGIFEPLFKKAEFSFCAVIETNRGCPNHCSYCDWGRLGEKLRQFSTERVYKEINWMAEHKIEYFWCADSSFGLFKRDRDIVDKLIETKRRTGYPKVFKVNYAEHREAEVYDICCKLNQVGMNKGATLSFQSLNPIVLRNIGRNNMTMERFAEMMALYNDAGIATYAELILGLPGETYESFCGAIETLIEAGQHNALNVHALVLLVNSQMADPEYIRKFGIKTVKTEFAQFHCAKADNDITEYYDLVVATNSMSNTQWIMATMFFIYIQTFHQLGLLQFFAIYLFYEKKINYKDFYEKLIKWSEANKQTICGKIYTEFFIRLSSIAQGKGSRTYLNKRYGNIVWPLEEGAFLDILPHFEQFYDEIGLFLQFFEIEPDIYANLMRYQKCMIKLPNKAKSEIYLAYDFCNYFKNIYIHTYNPLEKRNHHFYAMDNHCAKTWKEYAVENVWYGRNDSRTLFRDITVEYT